MWLVPNDPVAPDGPMPSQNEVDAFLAAWEALGLRMPAVRDQMSSDGAFARQVIEQAPTLGTSLLLAELFYKFHSFTLECLAFLATWYGLDRLLQLLRRSLSTHHEAS